MFPETKGGKSKSVNNWLCTLALLSCSIVFLLQAQPGTAQTASSTSAPTSDVQACGTFSDYLVHFAPADRSTILSTPKLPVSLMYSRYRDLQRVSKGYDRSGLPMVAFDGESFLPAGPSDDIGLYYLVPWISRTFHLSIDRTITTILLSALCLGFLVGSVGFMFTLKTKGGKAAAVTALLALTALAYWVGDVYVVEFASFAALVPWILYFVRDNSSNGKIQVPFLLVLGLVLGICCLVRFGSAPAVLIVAVGLLLFELSASFSRKTALVGILLLGFVLPQLYLGRLTHRAEVFLSDHAPGYQAGDSRHVFWHFAYLGLGFLSNPYVPGGICDEIAKDKVEATTPGTHYCSVEYNAILRHDVLSVIKEHPSIALFNIFAKLGIVMGMIVAFANVGLVAAFLYPKPRALELALWAAMAASAGPLIIMAPLPMYSLGVITMSVLYGIVSLDHALAMRKVEPPKQDSPTKYNDSIAPWVDLSPVR